MSSTATPQNTIEVAVRVRPLQRQEWGHESSSRSHEIPDSVKSFRYPSAVVVGSNQRSCFEAIGRPLLNRMSQGYNTTLLAYGQTGSGKTFTVFGPTGCLSESSLEQANGSKSNAEGSAVPLMWGIFPRIAHAMVSEATNLKASAVEIYQNAPFDLLNNRAPLQVSRARHATRARPVKVTSKSSTIGGGKFSSHKVGLNGEHPGSCTCRLCYKAKMDAKETRKNRRQSGDEKIVAAPVRSSSKGGGLGAGAARTVGETLWPLKTYQDVAKFARHIETSRSAAGHALNDRSSRSHCIVRLQSTRLLPTTGEMMSQKFTFVDLAGSERTGKSGVEGQRMSEAIGINNSLTVLGRCIRAVGKNEAHVPWRDAVLCQLLRSSFEGGGGGSGRRGKRSSTGGAHCSVIVNVSPEHEDETMCTLRFGETVACVANRATVVVGRDARSVIDDLRSVVEGLRRKVKEMSESGMSGGFVAGCQGTERQSLEANMAKHASARRDVEKWKAMVVEAGGRRRRASMEEKLSGAIKEEHHFRMMVLRQQSIKTLWSQASPNFTAAVAELEEKKQQLSMMMEEY